MNGKRFLAVLMSLCMLSAEASHCAPFITRSITARADSAETGSNSSGKVKSLTTRIGDVNGDGKVTEDDKTLLQKWLVQMVSDNELKLINADVNRDGTVDIMDLVELSRLCAQNPNYSYGSSDENISGLESAALGEDSEIFSEINTDDNAFKVSMDITASSEALASLSASESEYSNVIKNGDMVVGVVPEFECEEGAAVEDVTLNFKVEDSCVTEYTNGKYANVAPEYFEGVKRFNVFKYSEDTGILMPIKTEHKEGSNIVTANADELGTYCLVDMEQWFENLGIAPEEFATVNTSVSPVGMVGVPICASMLSGKQNTASAPIDVVFHDYAVDNYDQNQVEKAIMVAAKSLFAEYGKDGNVRIYVSKYDGGFGTTAKGIQYAENEEELQEILKKVSCVPEKVYTKYNESYPWLNYVDPRNTPYDYHFVCLMNNCSRYLREDTDRYYVFVENMSIEAEHYEGLIVDKLKNNNMTGIMLSKNTYRDTPEKTGGTHIKKTTGFGDDVANFIIGKHGENPDKIITVLSTNWNKGVLKDKTIKKNYIDYLEKNGSDEGFNFSDYADTDEDGLIDLQELDYNSFLMRWDSNGKADLFTPKELADEFPFFNDVISQYGNLDWDKFKNIRILPVKSDPFEKDSDFDDFEDGEESEEDRMKYNTVNIDDTLIDDRGSRNWKNPKITQDDLDKMIGHVEAKQVNLDIEDDSFQKNELIFTRTRKYDRTDGKFTITPSYYSDYSFTITGTSETKPEEYTPDAFNSTVKVFYKKKGAFKKEEKQVNPVEINLSDPEDYGDGTKMYTTIEYVFALEEGIEYSIYVNNPTNNHVGTYEICVSEDNWVYAPNGAYTEVCFEKEECDKILSHQIYIPSDIIDNMYWETNKWHIVKDEYSEDDYTFKNRCNDAAGSTVFKGDHYIELENYNELVSDIGEKATIAGVFTAVFSNGKFVGIQFLGKAAAASVGAASGAAGTTATVVGGLSLLLQSKATADLNDFRTNLKDSLYNGRANLVYNSTYNTTHWLGETIQTNYQWWSAWDDSRYINKYPMLFFGCDKINTLFDDLTHCYRQNIYTDLKYYGYMQDDPENHFWDLYATKS